MKTQLLKQEEILSIQENLPEWEVKGKKLIRKFNFSNFVEAFGFITKIAIIAESLNHHPEWSNVYSKVNIELTTHDLGGISDLDLKLAKEIDYLLNQ